MKHGINFIIFTLFIAATAFAGEPLLVNSIEEIQILKITPKDERAIIKTLHGKMQIIKVGDVLQVQSTEFKVQSSENKKVQSSETKMQSELKPRATELKVIEIAKGRVVFEERTDKGIETVIIRIEDGKQRVERIRKFPEKQPELHKPR